MAKHTPGPWSAGRNLCGELAIFTAKGKHTLSGEGENPLPLKQRQANAALQGAAPAMYAALLQYAKIHDIVSDIIEDGKLAVSSQKYRQLVNLLASTNINAVLELATKEVE